MVYDGSMRKDSLAGYLALTILYIFIFPKTNVIKLTRRCWNFCRPTEMRCDCQTTWSPCHLKFSIWIIAGNEETQTPYGGYPSIHGFKQESPETA